MSHYEIVDRFESDGWLVLEVKHFHNSGAFWYLEHYRWSGAEGYKHRAVINTLGQPLLDDGRIAPYVGEGGENEYYLPPGREWKWDLPPRMPGIFGSF